jgi:hypothetical protein
MERASQRRGAIARYGPLAELSASLTLEYASTVPRFRETHCFKPKQAGADFVGSPCPSPISSTDEDSLQIGLLIHMEANTGQNPSAASACVGRCPRSRAFYFLLPHSVNTLRLQPDLVTDIEDHPTPSTTSCLSLSTPTITLVQSRDVVQRVFQHDEVAKGRIEAREVYPE